MEDVDFNEDDEDIEPVDKSRYRYIKLIVLFPSGAKAESIIKVDLETLSMKQFLFNLNNYLKMCYKKRELFFIAGMGYINLHQIALIRFEETAEEGGPRLFFN